jgi:single-stranded DNA-binding protein
MTAHALIQGTLFRAPEQKISKNDKQYIIATVRAKGGDAFQFWHVVAFSETAQGELLRLGDGDAVSVQGAMKAELYQPDGGPARVSLSIIADAVLALRASPKEQRKPDAAPHPSRHEKSPPDRERLNRHGDQGPDVFGDDIPF